MSTTPVHRLILLGVPPALFAAGLLSKSASFRRFLMLPIVATGCYLILEPTGPHQGMYQAHTLVNGALLAADFLVLHDPQTDFWRVKEGKVEGKVLGKGSLWSRFKWAMELSNSFRAIGWNIQIRPIPASSPWGTPTPDSPSESQKPKSKSRLRFLLYQAFRFSSALLVVDLTRVIFRKRAACQVGGSITQDGLPWHVLYTLAVWGNTPAGMICAHAFGALLTVALGINDPEDWPNFYGQWKDAYTVRNFWGKTWHQMFRRFLTTNSKFMSQSILRLPKGQFRTYAELYISFFISGFSHFCGSYAFLRTVRGSFDSITFFVAQAALIQFEDVIIALGKRFGIKDTWKTRLLGYTWMLSTLVALSPLRLDPIIKGGLLDAAESNSYSIIQGVLEGKWFATMERSKLLA